MNETKKEYKTIKDLVLKLMAENPKCRDSDKLLSYRVYEQIVKDNGYNGIFIPFELFNILPSFETISRSRRYIQNDLELYLPNETVAKRRKIRRKAINKIFKEGNL